MPAFARLLILAVNYRNADQIVRFVESVRDLNEFSSVDVVIVDNLSGDDSVWKISTAISAHHNIRLFASHENRGYFGASRWGLQEYLEGGHRMPDWVVVCNHDVAIHDREFFPRLFAMDPMAAGVIAPRVQGMPAGVDQNPFMTRRPSRWRWASLRLISSFYGFAALWDWLSRHKLRLQLPGGRTTHGAASRAIYAPHGSFMIFSRRYFEAGGYLDGNLFLFGEEVSVAEICRSLNLAVVYEPSLCVLHHEHASTGKSLSRFTYECQRRALQYLTHQYFSNLTLPIRSL